MKKAHVIAPIPPSRVRSADGSSPTIGDVVVLEQGFTFPDGKPSVLVYFVRQGEGCGWEADVYESEEAAHRDVVLETFADECGATLIAAFMEIRVRSTEFHASERASRPRTMQRLS